MSFPSSYLFDFSQKQKCVVLTHKKNQEIFQFLLRILESLSKQSHLFVLKSKQKKLAASTTENRSFLKYMASCGGEGGASILK